MTNDGRLPAGADAPLAIAPILLLLALLAGTGCRELPAEHNPTPPERPVPKPQTTRRETPPIFTDITTQAGLDFLHFNGATGDHRFPEIMGPGCALLDYDQDGDLDIYAIQGTWIAPGRPITAPQHAGPLVNRLYRNDTATDEHGESKIRFTDVTEGSGLANTGFGMGCAVGDYDNDGFPDMYVTNFGSNALYHNNGDGTFTDHTSYSGTDDPRWSTSAAFVDYDQDGFLDLVVTNYVGYDANINKACISFHTGAPDYCLPRDFPKVPDTLFHNRGDGTFEDVSESSGLTGSFGWGLGVVCADFNGDDLIDLYVANDESNNQLWINQGNGTFVDRALMSGAALSREGKTEGGMGLLAEDFDRNGATDLFVSHFMDESNTLYVNAGQAMFEDRSYVSGLGFASQPMTGFGAAAIDYDNDGWQDIFVANGAVFAVESQLGQPFPYALENQLFRNNGRTFDLVRVRPDSPVLDFYVARGTAMGDIDNDGDMDLLISNNNGPLQLLRNEIGQDSHWVALHLIGSKSNRDALGAVVKLERPDGVVLQRRVSRDGSYCSANDPRVYFGLGDYDNVGRVIVKWPSGATEEWASVPIDRQTELTEGQGDAIVQP